MADYTVQTVGGASADKDAVSYVQTARDDIEDLWVYGDSGAIEVHIRAHERGWWNSDTPAGYEIMGVSPDGRGNRMVVRLRPVEA